MYVAGSLDLPATGSERGYEWIVPSMITHTQLQHYCQKLALPSQAAAFLARIRQSDPVRRVQGRAGNVSGFYSSRKMGMTIQFESLVELGAIYLMEHDPDVFAYYDQPYTFKLRYRTKTGKQMQAHYYTPDFLVLRTAGAVLEEWKTVEELLKLGEKQPYRYQKTENGEWRSPPSEEVAQELGLSFHLCPSSFLPAIQIDNLDFLADYFASPPTIPERLVDLICAQVQTEPGVTLAGMLGRHPEVRAHDVYALIASDQIYADLGATPLRDHSRTCLYLDQQTAQAYAHLRLSGPLFSGAIGEPSAGHVSANTQLLWDGRNFTLITMGETTTTLLPEVGEPLQIPSAFFLRLLDARAIVVPSSGKVPLEREEVKARMNGASEADRRIANERFRLVMAYVHKDRDQIEASSYSERTLRRWVADFRAAEASFGSGYVGLLPATSRRGNRQPKAPEASRVLLATFITEQYETSREAPAWEVYLAYQRACELQTIIPLSYRTFYSEIGKRAGHAQTAARQATKAAYKEEPCYWELTRSTPRHGNRPFALAHLDHTELDSVLVSSVTGKPLGKPWVTFLVDAYTRRLLSVYLTFDKPSYRSCMMALRICVKRFGRLPSSLVVDGGKDFQSVSFDALIARYQGRKKTRPGSKPRFGSVVERLFGTTNTEFVYNLLGNTQATKRPRQLTSAVDPQKQAVWTLADLYDVLCTWAYEVYDQTDHPALFQRPREGFAQGLTQTGEREQIKIPYADEFLMESSPTTTKGTAKNERGRGIKIHSIYYSALALRSPDVEGTQVKVRYDPFNIGVAYAYVKTTWVKCLSQYYGILQGHTEKELMLASKEIRQQRHLHNKNRVVTAKRLADLVADLSAYETVRQQRLRDLEGKPIRELLETTKSDFTGVQQASLPLEENPPLSPVRAKVDVNTLQIVEEFH
jgi:putative transposase